MKNSNSLIQDEVPEHWRGTNLYLGHGLMYSSASPNEQVLANHYAGGPLRHDNAACLECGRPFTLIWDIDLSDSRLPSYVSEAFAPASRLPLFICWQCCVAAYRVVDDRTVEPLEHFLPNLLEDESPHVDSPVELPHRPIHFVSIPVEIDEIQRAIDADGRDSLSDDDQRRLRKFLGVDRLEWDDYYRSQLGGYIKPFQGQHQYACSNRECPASRIKPPYRDSADFLMKHFAMVHVDAEPELKKDYFQLVYYVCINCSSITVQYECT
jgi:hypothetical protein